MYRATDTRRSLESSTLKMNWEQASALRLTGPVSFQVPFIEENKLPFAVVNGGLSIQLADLRDLTAALLVLHRQSNHQGL